MLMLAFMAVVLPSCGSDKEDDLDTKIKVTQSEIQGSWGFTSYGYYHRITFNGDKYDYTLMEVKGDIDSKESGTYTISGTTINFTATSGESSLGKCEIYWDNTSKNSLHIYPIGSFTKQN